MGFFDALSRGLERSREALNEVFYFGGEVDEDFWEDLEDTLVMGDMGAEVAIKVSDDLRDAAAKKNLKTAPQLRRAWPSSLSSTLCPSSEIRSPIRRAACCLWALTVPARPRRSVRSRAPWLPAARTW